MPDGLLATLYGSFGYADEVFRQIDADQYGAVTPCPEFTVLGLSAHLIGATIWYARLPDGGGADPAMTAGPDLAGQRLGGQRLGGQWLGGQRLAAVFGQAAGVARRAWTPAALGQAFATPAGEVKGVATTMLMVVEVLAHGWDLAVATGQRTRPTGDLAGAGLRLAHLLGDEALRGPGMMGPAVDVGSGAPVFDQLIGLLGRDPAWGRGPAAQPTPTS